jgi:asparagine synthase (glutamine-hydrolysing)
VTYNGEIYNFLQLRNELAGLGHTFQSNSDTEVLIEGYAHWGIEQLLQRLRGMFAFALYDARGESGSAPTLILARDRFGIKPLYYHVGRDRLVFASEVRALLAGGLAPDEDNPESILRFLQLGSVPAPQTTVKDVLAVPAGNYLVVRRHDQRLASYWDLAGLIARSDQPSPNMSLEAAAEATRDALDEAVRLHLVSDVPLGVFLSGGTDSSSLVALASAALDRPLATLSVIFDEPEFSEARYARTVASRFATDHREVKLTSKGFYEELPAVLRSMDQPTVDGVNTYFVSKAAREAGLTVVLSGTGGDEVFLGYRHFRLAASLDRTTSLSRLLPPEGWTALVKLAGEAYKFIRGSGIERLAYLERPSGQNNYLLFRGLFSPRQISDLIGVSVGEVERLGPICPALNGNLDRPFIESSSLLEFKHYLENQLLRDTDFMSMAHSIEARVPFLDHKLVELILGFPPSIRLGSKPNKPLLVKALAKLLPKEVYDRPKMGFTFPFGKWMMERADELRYGPLQNQSLNRRSVDALWEGFRHGKVHWSRPWAITVLGSFNRTPTTSPIPQILATTHETLGGSSEETREETSIRVDR